MTSSLKAALKGWSPTQHRLFPLPLKQGVIAFMTCREKIDESENFVKNLPKHIIYNILEFMVLISLISMLINIIITFNFISIGIGLKKL
jgi:hypothetical protein